MTAVSFPTLMATADFLAAFADQVFGLVCHQEAGRLLHIGGQPLTLCPRCIGMHGGFFATVILLGRWVSGGNGRERADGWIIPLAAVLGTLTGVAWLLEIQRIIPSDITVRLWTGLASGTGGGTLFLVYRHRRALPPHGLPCRAVLSAALACILLLAVLLPDGHASIATAILLAAVLGNAAMVGRTLLHLLLRRV